MSAKALSRALPLLDAEWLAQDPDLGPVLATALARGVGRDWHRSGTLRQHLAGVARTLTLWDQPRAVRRFGLLHSVYGNAYVDFVKFDRARERALVREAIGEEAEHLVHLFCTISRTQFVTRLLAGELRADGSLHVADERQHWNLGAPEVAAFVVVTLADMAEQWHGWQDEIFSRYPDYRAHDAATHWAASLWPGAMRPTSRTLSLLSRLAALFQHPAIRPLLPAPPVFDHSSRTLAADDETAATALYWTVVQGQHPAVDSDAALALLGQASRLNPWVGEPRLHAAQIHLARGEFDAAHAAAADGLKALAAWGTAWDKRIAWEAWVAWGRILLQSADDRQWPARLDRLNNLALKNA